MGRVFDPRQGGGVGYALDSGAITSVLGSIALVILAAPSRRG